MANGTQQAPDTTRCVKAEEFFQGGSRRPVKSLMAIPVDLVVRLYEIEGSLDITGDVPDDALIVVKNGGIRVEGYVTGHLVCDGGVEVTGNVTGGYVIAKQGDIHIEGGILSNAYVVAQSGEVTMQRAEGPRCVFGWQGVRVRGDVRTGRIISPDIGIGGKAASAELHVTGGLRAGGFETTGRGPCVLCLHSMLTSEEYGRPLSDEERRLTRGVNRHHYGAAIMARLIRYATRDIQDAQRTVLYLLLGGQLNAQRVRLLRGLQCQSVYVSELLLNTERIFEFVSGKGDSGAGGEQAAMLGEEVSDSVRAIEDDTRAAAAIFALEYRGTIISACNELQQWAAHLKREGTPIDYKQLAAVVTDRRTKWGELAVSLAGMAREQINAFGLRPDIVQTAETQPDKIEIMLQQVVAKLSEDPTSERADALRSPVVRLINAQVERNRKNIQNWQTSLDAAREEIRVIHRTLSASAATLFARDEPDSTFVTANAYAAETVIAANPATNSDPALTAGTLVRLSRNVEALTSFALRGGNIQRTQSPIGTA